MRKRRLHVHIVKSQFMIALDTAINRERETGLLTINRIRLLDLKCQTAQSRFRRNIHTVYGREM